MKRLLKNQRGVGAIEIVLIAVALGIIGFVGWKVYDARQTVNNQKLVDSKPETKDKTDSNSQSSADKKNKSHTIESEGLSFEYPESWTVEEGIGADNLKHIAVKSGTGFEVRWVLNANRETGNVCTVQEVSELKNTDYSGTLNLIACGLEEGKASYLHLTNAVLKVGAETDERYFKSKKNSDQLISVAADFPKEGGPAHYSLTDFNNLGEVKAAKEIFKSMKFN